MYFCWSGDRPRSQNRGLAGPGGDELLQAASGERHSLLLSNGAVQSCGDNSHGQLGRKGVQRGERPERIPALKTLPVRLVSCGKEHSLAVCHRGRVFAWGAGSEGQLGTGDFKEVNFIPKKITLTDIKIIQVSCGHYHSLALSEDGQVFSWGKNSDGQLGLGKEVPSQASPQRVRSLEGIPLAQVAAGGAHSFALSLPGTSFGWGSNRAGQLALSGNNVPAAQAYKPRSVGALKNLGVIYISCGYEHTAVLTQDGKVFTFGDNSYGQLGHSPTAEKRGPRLVERIEGLVSQIDCGSYHTLAYVYTTGQVVSFGRGPSCPGSSLHPEALAEDFDISCLISADDLADSQVKHIFAGTYADFVTTCQKDPSSNGVPWKTLPEISRIHQSLTEEWMAVAKGSAQFEAAKSKIKAVFSSPACLTASFLKKRECGETNSIYVDLQMARDTFEKLTKKDWISFLITTSLKDNLLPALPHRSRHQEALSVFLLLPECPVMHDAKNWMALVVPFAEAVRKMTSQSLQVLKQCWESLQESSLNALVQMLKTAIASQLYYWTETIQSHNNLKALLKMMKEVYKVNKANCRLPENTFYIDELHFLLNFYAERSRMIFRNKSQISAENFDFIIFSDFPFVFNLPSKIKLLQADSHLKMMELEGKAHMDFNQVILQRKDEFPPSPIFTLKVRRSHLVEDTLRQLSQADATDLRKVLVVEFIKEICSVGEGVKSEFFHCIFEEMIKKEYGLFIYPEDGSCMWFPVNPTRGKKMYFLFGILCGLSLYNLNVVNLPFPLALFKKLLDQKPSLEDLKELSPLLGKSLQEVLNDEADDIKEELGLCFSIYWDKEAVDLIPNGSSISVDQSNKKDYISKYVNYIFMTTEPSSSGQPGFEEGLSTIPSSPISLFMEQGSGEAAYDLETTTVSSFSFIVEPEIQTKKEAAGTLSPHVETILPFEPTGLVWSTATDTEVAEIISQTSKANLISEISGEPSQGAEIKVLSTGFPMEEDFSGDLSEYSTVSQPITKEETVGLEGSGDAAFKDTQISPSIIPPSDHTIHVADSERPDSTLVSTSAFPWEEFTASAEGSGEQLVAVSSSVDQVFPSAVGNISGTDSPFTDQGLGEKGAINETEERATIWPTAEARSTKASTEKGEVMVDGTVSVDFPQTTEPDKLWPQHEVNPVTQGIESKIVSEEKIQEQRSFESPQSSLAPEQTIFDSQTFPETHLRTTDDSVLTTEKTYGTDEEMEEGIPLADVFTPNLDSKGLESYTVLPEVTEKSHFSLATASVTASVPAESVITDSTTREPESVKPIPKVMRPVIKESDTDLLFSGLGSGEEVVPATVSVNLTEMEQVISTLSPQTSQGQTLETSILNNTTEDHEGMEYVTKELRPLVSKTDSSFEDSETASGTTSLEILSDNRTEGPSVAPLTFSTHTEHPQNKTHSWAEEIQTSGPQPMTDQVSNEDSPTEEMKETATPSTDFLARTYGLEMAKGFVTSTPKPSDLFYEHSGEGSGELDMVDLVHTSGTTQATRQESATFVSDRSLDKYPEVPSAEAVTVDGFPTVSAVLPLHSEQNESSPDPVSVLSSTMSYERSTEDATDSVQDHFGGFEDSTLKPDRRKATETIIIDLDKEDKDLILTITESTMLEILPELTSDKNTIIDIDHTKPIYEDILGMQTDGDPELSSGPHGSNEDSTQVQEKYEAPANLSLAEENFEASGDTPLANYIQATHNESMTSEHTSHLDHVSSVFTTGVPFLSAETEGDILLPTATSLPIPSKSAMG